MPTLDIVGSEPLPHVAIDDSGGGGGGGGVEEAMDALYNKTKELYRMYKEFQKVERLRDTKYHGPDSQRKFLD